MSRGSRGVLRPCGARHPVTAYGIFSRGLLSSDRAQLAPSDPRTRFPWFRRDHARNLELLAALETIAGDPG